MSFTPHPPPPAQGRGRHPPPSGKGRSLMAGRANARCDAVRSKRSASSDAAAGPSPAKLPLRTIAPAPNGRENSSQASERGVCGRYRLPRPIHAFDAREGEPMRMTRWSVLLATIATVTMAAAPASAQQPKPNILVIMGDDIGIWNISAYNRGQMGYRTPNIDRIANEGAIFTDYYGQQSCTAGRAAFITGQSPLRTGLLKVGLPGAK